MRTTLAVLAVVLGLGTARAGAAPTIMFVHDDARLATVNVDSGTVKVIGNTGVTMSDIAFDPAGRLFGITFEGLYEINPRTAAITFIGSHSVPGGNALVFDAGGTLYAAGRFSTSLYTINSATGATTNLGNIGFTSAGDLAFDGGLLYLASTNNLLVRIPLGNLAATSVVGPFGVANVFGLATGDDGLVYAVAGTQIYRVNTTTGAATNPVNYAGHGLGIANGHSFFACQLAPTAGVTSFSAAGGTGVVSLSTIPACAWSVSDNATWVFPLSDTQGNGSAAIMFRVAPNSSGAARSAVLSVGGTNIPISQSALPAVDGDLDASGSADLLWQHTSGSLAVWFMSGTTQIAGRPLGPGAVADAAWRIAASGDFDRDGSGDLIFQHDGDGRLAIWLMDGTTLLSGGALTPGQVADTNWKIRGAADVDLDGWIDLLWQHEATGEIAAWLMTGTQLREGRLLTPGSVADLDWRIVGVADMNGDDRPDLVWHHQTSGQIAAWLMNGTSMLSGVLLSPGQVADTNWKLRGVADINGDRHADLIWQNQANGMLSAWLMNRLSLIDGARLSPFIVSDTGWRIVGAR